jgi:histidyl-tRNA synthetase
MIRAVKGTRDILPPASDVWNLVEDRARETFRVFNYHEIRTPIFEETSLFARGVGEETDIVSKEMYTFEDRDGSSLTLRPEATASVMRSYIEHRLDQLPGIKKLYYMGPMFRRERPQKGRFRQFYQIGAEAIGSESPLVDGEVIELVVEILKRSGLSAFTLAINSVGCPKCRPAFVARLKEELAAVASKMCTDCQRRAVTNPLRVLDCKVPEDQPIIDALPSILDYLCEECRPHFETVKSYLDDQGIAYEVRPRLVRGLDYYMRTTFEILSGDLGAQNAILGGGRYDRLAEAIGSRIPAPGIGFSIGEDRLVMLAEGQLGGKNSPLIFVSFTEGSGTRKAAIASARELREHGFRVEVGEGKLKKVFETANKLRARIVIICGENEVAAGEVALKDMESHDQVTFPREFLIDRVNECLNKYH